MLFLLRIIPFVAGVWFATGELLAARHPEHFWAYAIAAAIGPIIALWLLTRGAKLPHGFGSIYFFPIFTLVLAIGALLFSEHLSIQIVFAVGIAASLALLFEQVFRFRYQPARYQPNALVNLSFTFALIGMFFLALTLFDLQLFASLKLWIVTGIFVIVSVLWFLALKALFPSPRSVTVRWGVTLVVVLAELFALFAWLPALPLPKAAMFTVLVTLLAHRYRSDVVPEALPQRWTSVLLLAMLLLLVVLTQWFA